MKNRLFIALAGSLISCMPGTGLAQAYITLTPNHILNRVKYSENVYTALLNGNNTWRGGLLIASSPSLQATENVFRHTTLTNVTLPASILYWRLSSIGGIQPGQSGFPITGDIWPERKYLTTAFQSFYEPRNTLLGIPLNKHPLGAIVFTYEVDASAYANYAFIAGSYQVTTTSNYTGPGFLGLANPWITPDSWYTTITVPATASWLSAPPPIMEKTISSLDVFRNAAGYVLSSNNLLIGHTLDFKFWAKAAASTIQFTSSKGVTETRPLSAINIYSPDTRIVQAPLTSAWKDYNSANNNFTVTAGNRNAFSLSLTINQTALKSQFFSAGVYIFQLNMNAKSTDGTVSALQNIDCKLTVQPLAEISVPTGSADVNFTFNTAALYNNGQYKDVINHIRLSNNENYELYVKAESANFSRNGFATDVPASILQIGPAAAQSGISVQTLSSTPQKIIANGTPVLDRDLSIRYAIPAGKAQSLIAKEKGSAPYTLNIIYSFTAL